MLSDSPHQSLPLEQVKKSTTPSSVNLHAHSCHRESEHSEKIPSKWLKSCLVEQEAALQSARKQDLMGQSHFFPLPQAWPSQHSNLFSPSSDSSVSAKSPATLWDSDLLFHLLTPGSSPRWASLGATVFTFGVAWLICCDSFQWAACLSPQKKCLLHQLAPISCLYPFWCQKGSSEGLKGEVTHYLGL